MLLPVKEKEEGKFNMPFVSSRILFPVLTVLVIISLQYFIPDYFSGLFNFDAAESSPTFQISMICFWLITIALTVGAFLKNWSLIPLLGLVTCLYLLTGMSASNWAWFASWLVLGLIIYFFYGYRKSKLAVEG